MDYALWMSLVFSHVVMFVLNTEQKTLLPEKQTRNSFTNLLILYSVVQVNESSNVEVLPLISLECGVTTPALFVPPSHH